MGFLGCNQGILQLEIAVKHCSKYKEWPIRMDDTTGHFYLDRSWATRVCWSTQYALTLLLLSFTIFREIEALRSDVVVIPRVIFIQLLVVINLVAVYSNAVFVSNGEHTALVLNMAIPLFKAYEAENPDGRVSKVIKNMAWLLRAVRYSFMVTGALYVIVMTIRLDAKESILSVLPEPLAQMCLIRFGAVFLYTCQTRSLVVVSGFLSAQIIAITLWTIKTLENLRDRIQPAVSNHLNWKDTLRTYTHLRILMREFNKSIAIVLPACKLVIVISSVLSAYAMVKFGGATSLFCLVYGLNAVGCLEFFLSICADVHSESGSYLVRLKGQVRKGGKLGKQLKALVPLTILIGKQMYFVDKKLMLTVLDTIVSNAASLLLAF